MLRPASDQTPETDSVFVAACFLVGPALLIDDVRVIRGPFSHLERHLLDPGGRQLSWIDAPHFEGQAMRRSHLLQRLGKTRRRGRFLQIYDEERIERGRFTHWLGFGISLLLGG